MNFYFVIVLASGISGFLGSEPARAQGHTSSNKTPSTETFLAPQTAATIGTVLIQGQLSIVPLSNDKLKLKITRGETLGEKEVWVVESSKDLEEASWRPYRIFVGSNEMTVPRRFDKEFFRVVKRKLPEGSVQASINVSSHVPAHYERQPDGSMLFVPERGIFSVRGIYSVNKTALSNFPNPASLYPPVVPSPQYSSLEAGVVGSNSGSLVDPSHTSFQWQPSQTFTTRAEAQALIDNARVFVVPRFLNVP